MSDSQLTNVGSGIMFEFVLRLHPDVASTGPIRLVRSGPFCPCAERGMHGGLGRDVINTPTGRGFSRDVGSSDIEIVRALNAD